MEIATLDEISGQRAILGVGAGISGFTELGINRRKPARAIREMIEVIRAVDWRRRGSTVRSPTTRPARPAMVLRGSAPILSLSYVTLGRQSDIAKEINS
jgi:alkanesulfonate monooxygenase SsuD/methylene tetrahydromethanopterin reductase-like flavin-dependent oxidoreductase (luciferase family)